MLAQGPKLMVAGGFLRACVAKEEPNDLDLFVGAKDDATLFIQHLSGVTGDRFTTTGNAFTLKKGYSPFPVQIIHRWTFTDPRKMISSFDFTIAAAAMWYEDGEWRSVCHPDFYQDTEAKRLVYTFPDREEVASGSFRRLLRFVGRGYHATDQAASGVVARMLGSTSFEGVTDERVRAGMVAGCIHDGY